MTMWRMKVYDGCFVVFTTIGGYIESLECFLSIYMWCSWLQPLSHLVICMCFACHQLSSSSPWTFVRVFKL